MEILSDTPLDDAKLPDPIDPIDENFGEVDNKFAEVGKKVFDEVRKEHKIQSFNKETENKLFNDLLESKKLSQDSSTKEISPVISDLNIKALKDFGNRHKQYITIVGNRKTKQYRRKPLEDEHQSEVFIETAEDDRVIGVPHTMATAGDKIYIINGRVMTGWSMYFSLTAIRSPEDYSRNVDLAYNTPYAYGSMLLKSQLGIAAPIRVTYKESDGVTIAEEKFIDSLLNKKLKINRGIRLKTAFHKYLYGNAYWHIRRDNKSLPEKITVLQPERLKIFLDPMTTRILFYIYLPPIIGGTVLTPYPDTRDNPNLINNLALTYPTPIVIRPEDVLHFYQNKFTEYPFGISDMRPCLDAVQARYDINLISPIIFKKYAKPMMHWSYRTRSGEGFNQLNPEQVEKRISSMKTELENMDPASDPITTDRWETTVVNAPQGKSDVFILTGDFDTQIFSVMGVPETYFKPKGSTDLMVAEQDKIFMGRIQGDRDDFTELIQDKIVVPSIDRMIKLKGLQPIKEDGTPMDPMDKYLYEKGSFLADMPRYPDIEWEEIMKSDKTQDYSNVIALNQARIISRKGARRMVNISENEEAQLQKEGNEDMQMQMGSQTSLLDSEYVGDNFHPDDTRSISAGHGDPQTLLKGGLKTQSRTKRSLTT